MTLRTYLPILIITFCLANAFPSYGQRMSHRKRQLKISKNTQKLHYDTSKTAIILFDQNFSHLFDNTYKPARLTQMELNQVDSLLSACVADYNSSTGEGYKDWKIDFLKNNYRKQLIVVVNKLGQKEVWVNCFCDFENPDWKTTVLYVDDGGSCFFNFKINLAKNEFYNLIVNGVA